MDDALRPRGHGTRRRSRPHEENETAAEHHLDSPDVVAFPAAAGSRAALGGPKSVVCLKTPSVGCPPDLRVVFLLRETEGPSILAIARDLGLNPVTVKTRLFRARRRLRVLLEERLRGGFDSVFPFDGARCAGIADRVVSSLARQRGR